MAQMSLSEGIDLLQQRGKFVEALLIAGFLLSIAMLAGQLAELNGFVTLDGDEITQSDMLYGLTALTYLVVLLVTYIVFGMWIYRAAANVITAQVAGFEYSAGWSVGWLFVPIANLFKPYLAMRQIYNASHGENGGALNSGNGILRSWWAAWLVMSISSNIAFRLAMRADTPEEVRTSLEVDSFSTAAGLILYPLAYVLVRRITRAQKERLTSAHIFT